MNEVLDVVKTTLMFVHAWSQIIISAKLTQILLKAPIISYYLKW